MASQYTLVSQVSLPSQSAVSNIYKSPNLADAFAIELPSNASTDPELLASFLFAHQPAWIGMLTQVRDILVSLFGLKTAKYLATLASDARTKRIGIFKVYSTSAAEVVLGEDDKHLDFRVSLLCSTESAPQQRRILIASTVVRCHNRLGRAYLFVIAPFHRWVVKASLRRAAHIGWPMAGT